MMLDIDQVEIRKINAARDASTYGGRLTMVTSAYQRDALGGHLFNRAPVSADMISNVVAGRAESYNPLRTNFQ